MNYVRYTAGGVDEDGKTFSESFEDRTSADKYLEFLVDNEIMDTVFLVGWTEEGSEPLIEQTAGEFLLGLGSTDVAVEEIEPEVEVEEISEETEEEVSEEVSEEEPNGVEG